jgi:glycosyltransferase involved in cell wall biosynthesis
VIKAFGNKVSYVYQENQGAGVARNRDIEKAVDEWIAFLDSDDRWLPFKLSLQFAILDTFPEYRAIHSNFRLFDNSGVVVEKGLEYWMFLLRGLTSIEWLDFYPIKHQLYNHDISHDNKLIGIYAGNIFTSLLDSSCANCITLLVHRDCLTPEVRFAENYPTWEDYWFFCSLSERENLIFVNTAVAEQRGHQGPRLTQTEYFKALECHIDIVDRIYMPSVSPYKPSYEHIQNTYKSLHIKLFKEYVKRDFVIKVRRPFFC